MQIFVKINIKNTKNCIKYTIFLHKKKEYRT